jgi:hypothetical protein
MILVYAIFVFAVILFLPADAWAWGPGMHMYIAMHALENIALVAPVIAKLMQKYPADFMYGAVIPDIVVGKKYAGYMHHCHNWRIGRLILSEAKTERQRAAAYGYLLHLAADVVAHNYYIPFKMVRSYQTRLLSHTYWEMRFDLGVPDNVWKQIGKASEHEISEFDNLLERVLKKTIFSFKTNKRIFSSILILQKMRGVRDSLKIYAGRSRWKMVEEKRQHYKDLTIETVMDFLSRPDSADCLQIDPAGISRLMYASNLRRRMKNLLSRGILKEKQARKLVDLVQERLAVGLYRPNLILPDVTDVLKC